MAQLVFGLGVTGLGVRDIVDGERGGFFVAAVGVSLVAVIGAELTRLTRPDEGASERRAVAGALLFVLIGLVVVAGGLLAGDLAVPMTLLGLVAGAYCVTFGVWSLLEIRRSRHRRDESRNVVPPDNA